MFCGYECYKIGGPWIAENPNCPVHGYAAQAEEKYRERTKEQLYQRIADAQTVEDLQAVLHDIVELI